MGNVNYDKWINGNGCCGAHNFITISGDCKGHDEACSCENMLKEISNLHTDDLILQDQIDELSGTVEDMEFDFDDYYTKEEIDAAGFLTEHQPLKTINGQVISGTGDIIIEGSGMTITVDSELDLNSTNPAQNKVITEALNDKLDATAYTPVDLSNYALKSEIPTVPTSNSAFTNDMHYVTSADTANYVTSGNVETQIVNHFWCGTQEQWTLISGNTQPNVLYLIHD